MAAGVPPPPLNSPSGSYYWLEWYTNLTNFLNGSNIPWSNINFTGSNIHDIQTRHHNSLTNVQGGNANGDITGTGNAFHLIGAQYIGQITSSGGITTLPTGWSISGVASPFTITHNLGLVATAYSVYIEANGSTPIMTSVTTATNSFVVYLSGAQAFNFVLCQGS